MSKFGVIIDRAHGDNVAGKCSPDAAKGLKVLLITIKSGSGPQ